MLPATSGRMVRPNERKGAHIVHEDRLLPVGQVASLLNLSQRAIWKLLAVGRLPRPVRLGRSVRWRAAELSAWIGAGCPSRDTWEARDSTAAVGAALG